MHRRVLCGLLALIGCFVLTPAPARADWLLTPFFGLKLDGTTNLVDLDRAAGKTKMTIGGSFGMLTDGLVGLDLDFGYTPGFFDSPDTGGLILRSNVVTLMGDVIIATPRSVTRDSLRPFVIGGAGLLHASS